MIDYLNDLIEFLVATTNRPKEDIVKYINAIEIGIGKFGSDEYRTFMDKYLLVLRSLYNENDAGSLVNIYYMLAPLSLYRYTTAKVVNTEINSIIQNMPNIEQATILDYGCGLAYRTFDIAQKISARDVTLLDIYYDVTTEFLLFLGKKYKVPLSFIFASSQNPYPILLDNYYNLAIFTEVAEHLLDPMKVITNIHNSLVSGGLLLAQVKDHSYDPPTHITPNLAPIRRALRDWGYVNITNTLYRKP